MISITPYLSIPENELEYTASRSSGPGGQHVNKTSTKITLRFDIAGSPSLSPRQKVLLLDSLRNRLTRAGVLIISSQETRSQTDNREIATARFVRILQRALKRKPVRKKTRPTRAGKERRIQSKKIQAEKKKLRKDPASRE
ncbi:MAG: alternative ribosome rescue aminoacyl-tRNA hydrolase ArfB [Desulfovibrionales bacterium]